jgi:UDP-N-acetylglucosamine--N-acetylmuramyl-(pentapeptide) pyrophosphoryl-undecaprenol N-acetylglucosamine transferase
VIVIAGGGTGGHTSPGLAVAALLRHRGIPCAWVGSRHGVEARVVPAHGVPYHAIATGKLRRPWAWRNVPDLLLRVPRGVLAAWRILGRLRPRAVLATGGYVAVPTVVAAALRRIPVVIHEQTAVAGLATRLTAPLARHVAVTFPGTRGVPRGRTVWTGNPLRPELRAGSRAHAHALFGLDPALPVVYVTGGAQGAHRLNRAVGEILPDLLTEAQVIHQCGAQPTTGDPAWLEARRQALPAERRRRYAVRPWLDAELAHVYAAATLVVGRAGAGTVNECCQLGLPALYVPLPGARGGEQLANARAVEILGGCRVLPQEALTPARLGEEIHRLLAQPAVLKEMGERARALAVPDAAERLLALVLEAG